MYTTNVVARCSCSRVRWSAAALVAVLLLGACIFRFEKADVRQIDPRTDRLGGTHPLKVHLLDGTTALFRSGADITGDRIVGVGVRYGILLRDSFPVMQLALDSVAGIEAFYTDIEEPQSTLVSVAATAGAVAVAAVAAAAAAVAIFGSCPTVYTTEAGTELLEAELFSYSIAPLLEGRDVDVVRARPGPDGMVRLEIRNEALETHYINHLELIEVAHAAHERVVPDHRGAPLVLGHTVTPAWMRDRAGRDVSGELAGDDALVFVTDPARLAAAGTDDLLDWIELALPAPSGADSVAIVLRMRNSLLTTILFYDVMLGDAGARALDWLAGDLRRIGPAVELGRWYTSRLGLHVSVREGAEWRSVARVPDAGPIAWKDVAVMVPVPAGADELRVRLSFVADLWRIDRAEVALHARRPTPRVVPVADVTGADGVELPDARAALAAPDEAYVRTAPGERFAIRFAVGAASTGPRTFLLSSQGYYTEWIRPAWIQRAAAAPASKFEPSDERLVEALRRWRAVQPEFEERFYSTRIPVR